MEGSIEAWKAGSTVEVDARLFLPAKNLVKEGNMEIRKEGIVEGRKEGHMKERKEI
jgi:hypothetical protein